MRQSKSSKYRESLDSYNRRKREGKMPDILDHVPILYHVDTVWIRTGNVTLAIDPKKQDPNDNLNWDHMKRVDMGVVVFEGTDDDGQTFANVFTVNNGKGHKGRFM